MRIFSLFAYSLLSVIPSTSAQSLVLDRSVWTRISENLIQVDEADRQIIPNQYLTYALDISKVRQVLATAPTDDQIQQGDAEPITIELPMPDGSFETFRVWDFEIMHPDLQAQFPEIRSFEGTSTTNAAASVFMDFTPKGFHAMTLRTANGSVFIDPYSKADDTHYLVYYKKHFTKKPGDRMECLMEDDPMNVDAHIKAPEMDMPSANCTKRREYRLAMAATGEYTAYHGGTVSLAMAAINTSMTRVNGVFVVEASIKMILIANNSSVVYTNASTDPFTNNSGSTMLAENQTNMTNVIGGSNYDIGHVFSTGGGGVATLGSPCSSNAKARGVTGSSAPIGDPFDIDYVAHEIGHQWGAPHTFASSTGSCSGNGSSANAIEPGSGSTIMAYAGICGAQNVQSNSDDYFSAISLLSMSNFVVSGNGNICDVEILNGNSAPTVTLPVTSATFPKSTPFVLTGSATDPNAGQAITYCWEQYDAALVSSPSSTNTTGPLFRSLSPVSENYRYFPSFDNTFGNTTDTWELLPSVARTLTFRLTARDNFIDGGCTNELNTTITIDNNGPFTLSTPNGGVSLTGNTSYTVTWAVAGTNTATPNVDILYSTNPSDPTTYVVLLSNTPNDGTQAVTLPNVTSTTFRMMVRSTSTNGNYFFDISNSNNSITASLPVTLTRFEAQLEGNKTVLGWTTASEEGNKGFTVQRSVNNSNNFVAIGWVNAAPNGRMTNHYELEDLNIKAGNTYFYRLQQVDLDGTTTYSDIRAVDVDGLVKHLQIAPNPTSKSTLLSAPGMDYETTFDVQIVAADGKLMLQRTMPLNNTISTADWPAGVYRVRAVAGNRIWTGTLVKQ